MSQTFDLNQFADLPPEVGTAFAAVQFELSVEHAARQHEQEVVAEKDALITELKALIKKHEGQIGQYRHATFGPKSEKLAIAKTQAQITLCDPLAMLLGQPPRRRLRPANTSIPETPWLQGYECQQDCG